MTVVCRRNVGNRFVPPIKGDEDDGRMGAMRLVVLVLHNVRCGCGCRVRMSSGNGANSVGSGLPPELEGDEKLKNIEPRMVEMIMNEVCVTRQPISM